MPTKGYYPEGIKVIKRNSLEHHFTLDGKFIGYASIDTRQKNPKTYRAIPATDDIPIKGEFKSWLEACDYLIERFNFRKESIESGVNRRCDVCEKFNGSLSYHGDFRGNLVAGSCIDCHKTVKKLLDRVFFYFGGYKENGVILASCKGTPDIRSFEQLKDLVSSFESAK